MPSLRSTERALQRSIREGAIDAASRGMRTSDFVVAFALALGAGNNLVALISSLPELLGVMIQPLTSRLIKFYKSRKKLCNIFALTARLLWVPILFVPTIFGGSLWALIALFSLSAAISSLSATIWTSWMCDLVPEKVRGDYFGKRNMIVNCSWLMTTLLAGWLLGLFNSIHGFILVFGISVILSIVSNYYLSIIPDVRMKCGHHVTFSYRHFLRGIAEHKYYSNFVMLRALLTFATAMISPFIVVYMLKNLGFGYFWFSVVIAAEILANAIMQPYWGRICDRYGERKVMVATYSLIPLVPLGWIFVSSVPQAVALNIFSGFAWAGFEIASFTYLLDAAPKYSQPIFIANYKLFVGLGAFAGPLTGAFLLGITEGQSFLLLAGLPLLFFISFLLRIAFAGITLPRIGDLRVKSRVPVSRVLVKAVVYPVSHAKHEIHYLGSCISCYAKKKGFK